MSNMYEWIDLSLNPLSGRCTYDCRYCYVKTFKISALKEKYSGDYRIDQKALDKIGKVKGKIIFVCSCNDSFNSDVPDIMTSTIVEKCKENTNNIYVFQSKNPDKFHLHFLPEDKNILFGTTLETTECGYQLYGGDCPSPSERKDAMIELRKRGFKNLFISVEPILDFNLELFLSWIEAINPLFVSIGADSKAYSRGFNLPEPKWDKVQALINGIRGGLGIEVREKSNLKRLQNVNN